MSVKRQPVAELGAEDYRIVRHTHDIELAERLMRAELAREYGEEPADVQPGAPHLVWVRIRPCLEGTFGSDEGWSYVFHPATPGTRGAFRAVEFR